MVPVFLAFVTCAASATAQNSYLAMASGDRATYRSSGSGLEVDSAVLATSGHWRQVFGGAPHLILQLPIGPLRSKL